VVLATRDWVLDNLRYRPTLIGPGLVYAGTTNTYTLTNFDEFSTYAVETDVGSVARSLEEITLTIPGGTPAGSLTLSVTWDGSRQDYGIAIEEQMVQAPTVTAPSDGATEIQENPVLTTSVFGTLPIGVDTHASTDWQIATDVDFTSIVHDVVGDTTNLVSYEVPDGVLSVSTQYFVRARHNGTALGASDWSTAVSFTTAAEFVLVEVQKLVGSVNMAYDEFGDSIDSDGTWAIVGALVSSSDGRTEGAAYIFENQGGTWVETQHLVPSDPGSGADQFGGFVGMSGNFAAASAWGRDNGGGIFEGAVYIFENQSGTWVETQKLMASDMQSPASFGEGLAMEGSILVVGSHEYRRGDPLESGVGQAYVFEESGGTWTETAVLLDATGEAQDQFGWDVATDGVKVAVSAQDDDVDAPGDGKGRVFVYWKNGATWELEQILTASDGQNNDLFGASIAMDPAGDRIAVGAPGVDIAPDAANGAVYIFEHDGAAWVEVQKLVASDTAHGDKLGDLRALSFGGSFLMVGAWGVDPGGAAYLFEHDGSQYVERQKLAGSDTAVGDHFGSSVHVAAGDEVMAGADEHDALGVTNAGAVYVFR